MEAFIAKGTRLWRIGISPILDKYISSSIISAVSAISAWDIFLFGCGLLCCDSVVNALLFYETM
jgi:hypothetical protein